MAENRIEGKEPLWMLIEKQIQKLTDEDFSDANSYETTRKIAEELDATGYNVSKSGGNWLRLRVAIESRSRVGRPLMQDFDQAISALVLDDIEDTYGKGMKIMAKLGKDWPYILVSENRADFEKTVRNKKTDLIIARAKELSGESGIRYLISQSFEPQAIVEALGVSEDEYKGVKAKVDAALAEKERVLGLFTSVEGASEEEKIKHLLNNNVADELIIEICGFQQPAIDSVKTAMAEELAEKKRKEEELATKEAAEAAGPSLDEIDSDDMLEYIEGIREVLEFSDVEKDIRIMCEQSSIPKALVDIAISDPDKLDELEKDAEG